LWSAQTGKKDIARLDPILSIAFHPFGKNVFGKAAVVCDEDSVTPLRLIREQRSNARSRDSRKDQLVLKLQTSRQRRTDFIESATMNPAFEESASLRI